MGKSKKRKHIDRHAHRGVGAPAAVLVRERPQPMGARPAPALSLPVRDEPLVCAAPRHDFRSRYPAKKTKRGVPAPKIAAPPLTQPPATPIVGAFCAPPDEPPVVRPPLLLLTYRPLPPSAEDLGLDWFDFLAEAPAEPAPFWCEPYLARLEPVLPPPAKRPSRPPHADPLAPLPRAVAVTAWKKRGPLAIIGYWLRKQLFKPKPGKASVAKLRAENAALRHRLATLEALTA